MAISTIVVPTSRLTVDALRENFPERRQTITQEHVDMLNKATEDPEFNLQMMLDEMVSYKDVMLNNSMTMTNYLRAVKFVSYLPQTKWNVTEAYRKAFPDDGVVQRAYGKPSTDPAYEVLVSQATRYSRTPGVKQLQVQSDLPLDYMLMGERMKMLAVLSEEATTANYSKDRITAADKFLTHTKTIETANIKMEIGPTSDSVNLQSVLENQLSAMMKVQKMQLEAGMPIENVQKIGVNLEEVDE